jgi:TonB family protein
LQEGNATMKRLIAVTRDAALSRALEELTGEVSVVIVKDLRELTDQMLQQGSNLALLDAAAVDTPLVGIVDSLVSQFPDLRLMVAGQAREQNLLASRIANESVFRFVHKPVSPQRLQLFLEAAARESGRRRDPSARADGAAPRPPSRLAFMLAGLVAVALAATAAWLFWPHGAAARLNARDLAKVEKMLGDANSAMAASRFVSFDGTSAAELYRDVLQLDAANERARTGLEIALNGAIGAARQALADGKLDEASNEMEAIRLIAPQHAGMPELQTQVDAETQRQLADAKARDAMMARQSQIRAAVDRMQASIRAGALLDPAGDNATTQFQEAQSISAGDPAVRSARSELTGALVDAGEKAVSAKHLEDARRYATATGRINSGASGLAALLWHIDQASAPAAAPPGNTAPATARTEPPKAPSAPATTPPPATAPESPPGAGASQPATSQAAQREGTLIAGVPQLPSTAAPAQPIAAPVPPPAAAAQHAPAPADEVVSASKLKVLRTAPADYPREALDRLVSGWVDLEFTVAKDGSVKDVKVSESEPGRTFDDAAVKALSRYRFAPVVKDGQPVEQRAKLRVRFTAKDQR